MRQSTILVAFLAAATLTGPICHAAEPPGFVNYQGVLRDASDRPLDGDHDMVFRFFSAATGGDEILIDRHTAAESIPVTVSGGLFSVRLGAGGIQDGSGPGIYTVLVAMFRDYTDVWLQVEVGGEALAPRVQVAAAPYAHNAKSLDGRSAAGFINTTSQAQTKIGQLTLDNSVSGQYGLEVYGMEGAYFEDADQSGQAWITNGNWGVVGKGNAAGGSFEDLDDSGYANVGMGDHGIQAYGNVAGGSFDDLDNTSSAQVALAGFGIYAEGNDAGGYFYDSNQSGYAFIGYGNNGIQAAGDEMGGHFSDLDQSGYAYLANGNWGIGAYGGVGGGYFEDTNSRGIARLGYGDAGINAEGAPAGRFDDALSAAYIYVGNGDRGFSAWGDEGGFASDLNTGTWVLLGSGDNSTLGNGSKNFIQNHPYDPDRIIAYTSLEGDEVGTYTRGTAKLAGGEARVSLGETFRWVTNPDIGLTVHLTPVGEWSDLYVAEKSTREIVVRSHTGNGNAVFDYVVFGLRIGFEESAPVREKTVEALIPSMTELRNLYERRPELRRYSALERFKAMAAAVDSGERVDLAGAEKLRAAIQEYDPAVHGPADRLKGAQPMPAESDPEVGIPPAAEEVPGASAQPGRGAETALGDAGVELAVEVGIDARPRTEGELVSKPRGEPLPAVEVVEAGQVLAFDLERPGRVGASSTMADPGVVGVAVGMAEDLEARVVLIGAVKCKVDAGYGAIRAGDLLTSSPTRGHAMRAIDAPAGTILGKALEPLETGTGTIRILVMPR